MDRHDVGVSVKIGPVCHAGEAGLANVVILQIGQVFYATADPDLLAPNLLISEQVGVHQMRGSPDQILAVRST